jgi:hypothetical protein
VESIKIANISGVYLSQREFTLLIDPFLLLFGALKITIL